MNKCICLSRVSTGIQDLDQQTDKLLSAAKSNGYNDDDIIVIEDVESGIKLSEEERYGLNKLKSYVNAGGIDIVIVYELSRLGRRPDVLYRIRDFLIQHRVQLQCLNPSFKILNPDGTIDENSSILFSLFGSLAESEMRIKKARFKRGRQKKASENKFIGGSVCYGYKYDSNKNFYIDENEASVVRRIFNDYSEGKLMADIARELINEGLVDLPMRSCQAFVQRTLHNQSYIGTNILDKKNYKKIQYPRVYPQIISKNLFDEVQSMTRKSTKQYSKYVYLCRGIIKTDTGKSFWVNTSSSTYTCVLEYTTEGSRTINVNISALDKLVWNYVQNYILNRPRKDKDIEIKEYMSKIETVSNVIKTLEKRLQANTAQIERLELRIIKGKLSEETAERIENELNRERKETQNEIQVKKEEIEAYKKMILSIENNDDIYTEQSLDSLSIEQKRELVLSNIQLITIDSISRNHRLVAIFTNIANDCELFDLNVYSKTWEKL